MVNKLRLGEWDTRAVGIYGRKFKKKRRIFCNPLSLQATY